MSVHTSVQCVVKLYVDRRRTPGLGVFSEGGSKRITTYPEQVRHTLAWMFRENILRSNILGVMKR